jgi:hypothetical protein
MNLVRLRVARALRLARVWRRLGGTAQQLQEATEVTRELLRREARLHDVSEQTWVMAVEVMQAVERFTTAQE